MTSEQRYWEDEERKERGRQENDLAEHLFQKLVAPETEPCPSCGLQLRLGATCPVCGLLMGY